MSDRITAAAAQACLRSALADEVLALGGFGAAAMETGHEAKTLRRWHDQTHGDWTAAAIAGLIAAAIQVRGISIIVERMQALAAGRPPGEAMRAQTDLAAELRADGALVSAIGAALSDGRIDPREAGQIARLIRDRQAAEQQVLADLDALSGGAR